MTSTSRLAGVLGVVLALAGALSACSPSADPSAAAPAESATAVDAAAATDEAGYPLAPSAAAKTPCPDDGERLPLSGACRGRAHAYLTPDASTSTDAPAGCEWMIDEVWFAGDVMLYRGLQCGANRVKLDYAGGAKAAEISYVSAALHPAAVPTEEDDHKPILRVATYYQDDDFRLKETIGSDADIATCEIRPAGPGYPDGAKVIAPKTSGANCGGYALSDDKDNFWLVRGEWVFAFMLPKGERDIDPSSFTVVTPQ
jgi:hypothetical protein